MTTEDVNNNNAMVAGTPEPPLTSTISKLRCRFNPEHLVCYEPVFLKCQTAEDLDYSAACMDCITQQVIITNQI